MGRLLAVGEAYPELRAQERFCELVRELHDTEGRIAIARQVYNDTALTYNNRIQTAADRRCSDGRCACGRWPTSSPRGRRHEQGPHAFWAVVVVVILALSFAPGAIGSLVSGFHFPGSRYYDLPSAEVDAVVKQDGSVRVIETITFSFHGSYSGAFRDIPLAAGPVDQRRPRRRERHPVPAGRQHRARQLRHTAGSFGDVQLADRERIVWHYSAFDEPRAFTLSYVLHGVLIVHPDVVDMNMNVWGDGWPSALGTLFASVRLPPGRRRRKVWGNPPFIEPTIVTHDNVVSMRRATSPNTSWSRCGVLFPSNAIAGCRRADRPAAARWPGSPPPSSRRPARTTTRSRRLDTARRWWPLTALCCSRWRRSRWASSSSCSTCAAAASTTPATTSSTSASRRPTTRRRWSPSLVAQREHVGSREFTATLFDLIVRKQVRTLPADNASLAIASADGAGNLSEFEQKVADMVDMLQKENGGPVDLDKMGRVAREADRSTRNRIAQKYNAFETAARREVRSRGWVDESGSAARIALAVLLGPGRDRLCWSCGWRRGRPTKPFRDALELAAAGCLAISCVITIATPRTVFNRRTREAALLGDRWDAFRRFLDDFPRFADAVPVQIEIWERLLVYGIAFGLADKILDEAKLRLPEEVLASSPMGPTFWIIPWGGDDWAGGLSSSFAPPPSPSSSSGGGGGFSGGGGGSFGGGGGGAW